MEFVSAFALYASAVVAAVFASAGRFRPLPSTAAGFAAMVCGLLVPEEHTFVRFVFAVSGFALLMRIFDLRIDRRRWSTPMRLWLCTAAVDVREATPTSRRLDGRALIAVCLYAGLAALGWWLSHDVAEALAAPWRWLLRWGGGAVLIYGVADAGCGGVVVAYGIAGYRIPPQHRSPVLATSVGGFWSRHYNLNVSAWLGRHFHRPLAQRGRPRLGLLAAFTVSTLVHAWVAWVPLDVPMAASMGGFFVVQGLLVVLERTWSGFARLPTGARRVWTVGWLLCTSPLFVEPFLRIIEG